MKIKSKVRLDLFDKNVGLKREKNRIIEAMWYISKMTFFLTAFPWPSKLKCNILRLFGAKIGQGVVLKPRVNIHFPWKLKIGDYSWIGEEVFILNFEKIEIGDNVCISQRAFLCGGNHDYRDEKFAYKNGPITIKNGVWIGATSFVASNIIIEEYAVVTAGSVVTKNLPASMIFSGNPCVPQKPRWKDV